MRWLTKAFVMVLIVSQAAVAEETPEYREYLGKNAEKSLQGRFFRDGLKPLTLVVTITESEEKRSEFGEDLRVRYGCRISEEGQTASFQHTRFGSKGGGAPFIAADDWKRLQELMGKLPDDRGKLPLVNRRLIVQVREGEGWKNRIYDRANAPDEVLEVLRLTGYGLGSWVDKRSPVREIEVHDAHHKGFLCLSPDGKSLISGSRDELTFVGVETHKIEKRLNMPRGVSLPNECILSPNGAHAIVAGLGEVMILDTTKWEVQGLIGEPYIAGLRAILTSPHFTSRGTHLLVHSSLPQLVVLNTENWERVSPFPAWPVDAVALYASEDRAIYHNAENVVALWDIVEKKLVAKLDEHGRLDRVAFSPDHSLVVAATRHRGRGDYWNTCRIRIWKTATGDLLHELRPFEQRVCEDVAALQWTPDGRYILAATKSHPFFTSRGIGVWSVATGRHRVEFEGGPEITGVVLLPGEKTLVAGGNDGKLRMWDAAAAFQSIDGLERSLAQELRAPDRLAK